MMCVKEKVERVNSELTNMKESQIKASRFGYIRDYIFPAIGMATVNYPIFWLMGPKTGMIASTVGYMLWKLI